MAQALFAGKGAQCKNIRYFRGVDSVGKIILVGPAHPLRGGIAHFNEAFCRSLLAAGVDAHIVSFYLQYPELFFPGKTQYSEAPRPADLEILPLLSSVDPRSWYRTLRYLRREAPDVLVIRFWIPFLGPCLSFLARGMRRQCKVIALIDNLEPHEARPGDRVLTRLFLTQCHGYFTMSRQVARDVKRLFGGSEPGVWPHPIYNIFGEAVPKQEARAVLGIPAQAQVLLFFGFVRRYKGLDLLIQALGLLRPQGLRPTLVVAGEFYEDRSWYEELIAELGLADQVIIKDAYIPEAEVRYYFGAADLVTQTYRSATQSGVTQIAYHFGKAMLVTDVGGLAEIVDHGHSGLVVAPNAEAIAAGIRRFYGESLEVPFAEAVVKSRGRYSWEQFSEAFLAFAAALKTTREQHS